MMDRKVYIDTMGYETRRLVVEDGKPVEYAVTYADSGRAQIGSIHLARVEKLLKGMHAAFVDIGGDKNAFLSLDDVPGVVDHDADIAAQPKKPIKPGQSVIVQVVKDAGGTKGPRVSMNPTLPGDYVVLLPTIRTVGISKHIQDVTERQRLQQVGMEISAEGMGVVLRTAAEGVPREAIMNEAQALRAQWLVIEKDATTRIAPAPLLDTMDLAASARRDLQAEPIIGPFDTVLETRLEKDLRRKVWLDCGGYIVIDHCEAMTVIDVNSGKYTGSKSLDNTLLKLNQQAAEEIARQLRLRDMGGIIVIDFVDMQSETDRESVLETFRQTLASDRAKHHVHGFTGAGLLEMTRRPLVRPLAQATQVECACCHGEGLVTSPQAQAHALLRGIRRRRQSGDESQITLTVSPETAQIIVDAGMPDGVTLHTT